MMLVTDQHERAVPLRPGLHSAAELQHIYFAPIKYVVQRFIAEGCTILAGRPKLGKSWLMLDAGLAVATGGTCFGGECEQGEVLYLALEDNHRRMQERIRKLLGSDETWPSDFFYDVNWDRADRGGVTRIRNWLKGAGKPRLVVVDVLAKFRSASGNENSYEADYGAVSELQTLASEFNVAIVIVHHIRKAGSDLDPFEKVSGTMGLTGAADTTLVLDRSGSGVTLYGRGRDIEEVEVDIQFDRETCRWRVAGPVSEARRSDERTRIITALAEGCGAMSPTDVAASTGMKPDNVRQLLLTMVASGELVKSGRGKYVIAVGGDHNDHMITNDVSEGIAGPN
jgi:hypothetical protein